MIRNIKILWVAALMTLSLGCGKDFLEVEPKLEYFEENYYQTEEQAFLALVAAYDPLQWTYYRGWSSWVMFGEIRSDNANAGGDNTNNDQPNWQQYDDFTSDELTEVSSAIWSRNYRGIYRCNLLLNNVAVESFNVDQYQAEARFLRAFYHFDLFRHFGPVPVLTEVKSLSDPYLPRNKMSEVFAQIITDLRVAEPLLPVAHPTQFAGRATKGAAQALLGKAYLYWADLSNDNVQRFDSAAYFLNQVVASGAYQLEPDFADLFAFGVKHGQESVFEINHSNETPSNWGWNTEWNDGNPMVQLTGIRGLCTNHPEYTDGWGFMLPTTGLVNSYLPDDQYRLDAAVISVAELQADINANGGACAGNYYDVPSTNPLDFEGYWQQKFANYKGYSAPNGGDLPLTKDANIYVIRYADVLLMLAEALHRGSGSDADAKVHIDLVRARSVDPAGSGTYRNADQVMNGTGWTLLDLIWYERRAELAMEGDRWFDLVRSGRASASLFPAGNLRAQNFQPEHVWLAMPQTELDATQGALTLYPDASLFD